MKRTLYKKLFSVFLLFGICGFFLVATVTFKLSFDKLKQTEAENLYEEAVCISSHISDSILNAATPSKEIQDSLLYLSHYLDSPIWIIQPDGKVICTFTTDGYSNTPITIDDFKIQDFKDSHYMLGNFYDYFQDDHLSVLAPISGKHPETAYVIIHKPFHTFHVFHTDFLNITYLAWAIMFSLGSILFLIFKYKVYRPLYTISIAAKEYAKGNYSTPISVHSNDSEIEYIAVSLNYMADKLDTIEEKQRNFVSNVSHDFRSPLTSIRGYIDAILDGTIPPELQGKYLNIILFETERLEKLTESLLELSKYEGKSFILDTTDFDINGTIQKTSETFEGRCREKRLHFSLHFSEEILRVHADFSKIQQVLYNLIDNAIKFSNPDSQIDIETISKNGKAYISIKDYGIGIPRDSITKIWERFYKSDLSRGKDKRGTGLGLAIVKEIISAHEENINVISTEGVGTEFIFTLPLSKLH